MQGLELNEHKILYNQEFETRGTSSVVDFRVPKSHS